MKKTRRRSLWWLLVALPMLRAMQVQLGGRSFEVAKKSLAPKKVSGADLVVTEHFLRVPLDYGAAAGEGSAEEITIFVREVAKASRLNASLPYLVYQQGGPGFPATRPTVPASGWQKSALEKYRLVLLDQRGTGRSTPVTCESMPEAAYLTHFRADSIVKDSEIVRELICDGAKITLLGQSYGGFVNLCYLSTFPHALERCLFFCGLAPVGVHIDDVYAATFKRMEARCGKFYRRYPEDVEVVRDIVRTLHEGPPVPMPRGGTLTARRFLQLGLLLGSGSGLESLHDLLEGAKGGLVDGTTKAKVVLSRNFLLNVERTQQSFETNPIYWLLHEPIYACGKTTPLLDEKEKKEDGARSVSLATAWSAERVQKERAGPQWDYTTRLTPGDDPILLTGEMVYSWMADDYAWLRPLKDVADALAKKDDWGALYDTDVLRNSPVPCAALMSYDDIYVERLFSENVAAILGPKTKVYVSNEFQHSAIRDNPALVFDRLHDMAKGDLEY